MSSASSSYLSPDFPCFCGLPSRVWTSKTRDHPGQKFRRCANYFVEGAKKCKYWDWVDKEQPKARQEHEETQSASVEMNMNIPGQEFNSYKFLMDQEIKQMKADIVDLQKANIQMGQETMKMKEDIIDLQKANNFQRSIIILFLIVFAVKGFSGII